jgi:hypothetical protein
MLIAIIGVLLAQYIVLKHKPEPDYVLRPFRMLLWRMFSIFVLSAFAIFGCLLYLLNINTYYLIIALFIIIVVMVVGSVFQTVYKVLGEKIGQS